MKGLKLYLIGGALAMVLYLIAQYYKPKPTDWTPSYLKEDKIPFGLYILFHEVERLFPDMKIKTTRLPAYNTLKGKHFKKTAYLFIAGEVKFSSYDYRELVQYMRDGNDVFIATFNLNRALSDKLKIRISSSLNYTKEKSTPVNFVNPVLKGHPDYVFDKGLGDQYFSKIDTLKATVLGRNANGEVNFVKYTFGKGGLYLLPNPQLLSNYNLLNLRGAEYAARALSYLPTPETLIWDENNTRGSTDDSDILRVLFKHAPLRWAYYLALTGLLVFVFFEMKRRQRIIPIVSPLKNSSVDFVRVVGKVYYQQRDNRDIAHKKISYFLEHIRATYRLKTTVLDKEFVNALAVKSGLTEIVVQELFILIRGLKNAPMVNDQQLIDLNKSIEKFYKQAQ